MTRKPKVGDVVRLNDKALESIRLQSWEAIRQASRMTVTWVGDESLTFPEVTWPIEVDQPLVNMFLLDHRRVELV